MNINRSTLRKSLLEKRCSLSFAAAQEASQAIATAVCASAIFCASQHLACYVATKGEVDVEHIMRRAWELGKNCYLPIIDPKQPNHLVFVAYRDGDHMQHNRYGILEPVYDAAKVMAASALDLVITPLVSFDEAGNRLGQGGGYYDRTFAFKLQAKQDVQASEGNAEISDARSKPFLLGVAYEWQKVVHLASAPWDVGLDMVVTEKKIYSFY